MKRKKIVVFILSFILSLCTLIGISFSKYSSLKLIYDKFLLTILLFTIILFIIYKILFYLYTRLDCISSMENNNRKKSNKFLERFDRKPILFSFILILLGWSIYIIAFYPGIMTFDPSFQILQYFGIDNKYSYYSVLLDKNMIITNHHPVIHTLLLGTCVKIGLFFHSVNLGIFLYSIL